MTRILALLGPTASGKTEVAVRLAHHYDAEVLSVDSMQVYRGMDIGTAKPTVDERDGVIHHMIDVVDPEYEFSVAEFQSIGRSAIAGSEAKTLIISGGSGLHFRALVDSLSFPPTDPHLRAELEAEQPQTLIDELLAADPSSETFVDMANNRRVTRAVEIFRLTGKTPSSRAATAEAEAVRRYVPEIEFTAAGVDPGSVLEERVERRLGMMRSRGLVEEVTGLSGRLGRTARNAVGYREILDAIASGNSVEVGIASATQNTKMLARKQRTWFQRDPRIRWIPWNHDVDERVRRLIEFYG